MRTILTWVCLSLILGASAAQPPAMTPKRTDIKPFEYVEAHLPFYPPGAKGGTIGKKTIPMQKPLDAAESQKHFVHPTDFELKLFVSEPQIKRPICMNWDERGRLWIAESVDYPNELKPKGEGRDRIVICADTDGDGVADKFTVFADKLSIPTSFVFANGGVVVHQAPDTLFLRSSKGDDVADERKVLFTGWATGDTHAGPSNLQQGFDNWLYGIVGYSGFQGVIGGEKHSFRTGFYRFKPDGSRFEFLRNTNNNSWGVGFSEEGVLFGSTANGNPSVYMPIANRYYESVRGWSSKVLGGIAGNAKFEPITAKVRQVDYHGHFTAAAGHALYTARTYPQAYWNRTAFVCEPTGHLAATFELEKKGADYTSRNSWNLLASADEWAAPIMAEVGPDGNVWVIDWYNYIIQHNPTPPGFKTGKGNAYETPFRDKTHGRIYRLVARNAQAAPPFTLQDATPEKLVATLKNDNLFWRRHAQRLLVERGKTDVVPALVKLVEDPSVDAIGLNVGAIHALWTLHGLGVLGKDFDVTFTTNAALKHPSAGVRRNAALVLPRTLAGTQALLASKVLEDADGQVQLAALLALAEMPADRYAGYALARVLHTKALNEDRWLADALTSAAAKNDQVFLASVVAHKGQLVQRSLDTLAIVAEHHARGKPASLTELVTGLEAGAPARVALVLQGLSKGWPKGHTVPLTPAMETSLERIAKALPTGPKSQLIQLATTLGSKRFVQYEGDIARTLLATLRSAKESEEERSAAARRLCELYPGDAKMLVEMLDLVGPRLAPELAAGIIDAVGATGHASVAKALLERYPSWPPAARSQARRVLVSRPEAVQQLLIAAAKGQFPVGELTLDEKQAILSNANKSIAQEARLLLEKSGGLPSPDRQKVLAELLPIVKQSGDAKLGKELFKKHCASCHRHGSEGNTIGPDLTGVAVHTKEHLLTDILDPSRNVEGNFRIYTVTTAKGQALQGLLASETKTSIELIDAQAKRHTLLREDIDELLATTKSLMPEGFEKQMTALELTHLLEFLALRGQFLPLPLGKVANVVSTRGMFLSEASTVERMIFPDWNPKIFEGVPFQLIDPQGARTPNMIMLYGPQGTRAPKMPKAVSVPCNSAAKTIHLLSGVSGWGYPLGEKGEVTLIVRLHYADGTKEEHALQNGVHFADYIRRVDVPGSKFAYSMGGKQLRYLAIQPKRGEIIASIELVKGGDGSAPLVVAMTVERP